MVMHNIYPMITIYIYIYIYIDMQIRTYCLYGGVLRPHAILFFSELNGNKSDFFKDSKA